MEAARLCEDSEETRKQQQNPDVIIPHRLKPCTCVVVRIHLCCAYPCVCNGQQMKIHFTNQTGLTEAGYLFSPSGLSSLADLIAMDF